MTTRRPSVLVVAYDFPPHGAIGTMRTLRLVRRLHQDNWNVTVLTGSPDTYLSGTPRDPELEKFVPPDVTTLQVRARRPFNVLESMVRGAIARTKQSSSGWPRGPASRPTPQHTGASLRRMTAVTNWVEAALDIPDKESGWIVPAALRGLRHMASAGTPDVIYSSAPPWSGQVVAWILANISRRPWLADFRDPWARAPWRSWGNAFRRRAVAALERRVVTAANGVLFVTAANLSEFAAAYGPRIAEKFRLVPNGCDPTELESLPTLPRREEFVLLHAGTLYGGRSPMPMVHAIARAVQRGAIDAARFRLRLLGTVSLSVDLEAECRQLGIPGVVELVPRVTRAESLQEMRAASALLLLQTGTTVSIPGKAYEYLAAGRPILALSDEGETASLVRASGAGVSLPADAPPEAIDAALLEIVFLAGRPFTAASPHLFDGRVHAATTAGMLLEFAHHGRNVRLAVSAVAPATPACSAATEEAPPL